MKPSSFCAISTYTCHNELIGLLLSLSLYHPNEIVYCLMDSKTQEALDNMTPKIRLDIRTNVALDKYSGMNRQEMEMKCIWNDFQMSKANVIKWALSESSDTYFLDADIIILDEIDYIDNSKDIGVSPQFCAQKFLDETGKYNGGTIWVKNKNVPDDWIEFTKTSRFHDQASIEDLVNKYTSQEFDESVNFGWWRLLLVDDKEKVRENIKIVNDKLCYDNKPIKYFHTHFHDKRFFEFNMIFINSLTKMKRYKELLIIERVIENKWTIQIPRQPQQQQLWCHNNDSFRELAILLKKNNKDVDVELTENGHCWLKPRILLYDRPSNVWFNNDVRTCSKLLLGNGDMNVEGKLLLDNNVNVSPWIFWPRRPMILEKLLNDKGVLSYEDRGTESIFIGNYENSVQEKHRNTNTDWSSILTEYHCTKGDKHKFTQKEYLMKLRNSRYGLCLRGYGSKCHREVELMAFGTVLIITPEVSIASYMEPLIENTHYISVKDVDDYKNKVSNIPQKKWKVMSNACYEYYQRNIHSRRCWSSMIHNLMYVLDTKRPKYSGAIKVTTNISNNDNRCVLSYNDFLNNSTKNAFEVEEMMNGFLSIQNTLKQKLESNEKIFIGRLSGVETRLVGKAITSSVTKKNIYEMSNNAGINITNNRSMEVYVRAYIDSVRKCNILGVWNGGIKEHAKEFYSMLPRLIEENKLVPAQALEPFYFFKPSKYNNGIDYELDKIIENKSLLMISCHDKDMREQEKDLDSVFKPYRIFNNNTFKFLCPPQTIASNNSGIDWIDHFNDFKSRVKDSIEGVDVVFVSCGGYSMLICDYIFSELNTSVIYVGGPLQLFWGIIGNRWNTHEVITEYRNNNRGAWIRPSPEYRPPNYNLVEAGCYW